MKSLFRFASCLLAFLAGVFIFWFLQATQAGIPRSGQALIRPQTINLITIVEEQKWILDYELSATSLDVDSKREYVLILLTPLGENSQPPVFEGYAACFELTGLTDPESSLVFRLIPGMIKPDPEAQYINLMELTGNLFNHKRIELTDKLELKAQELDFDERAKGIKFKFEGRKWHQI